MKQTIVGIFIILSIIALGYIGLTNLELAKVVDTCYVVVIFIIVIVDMFITRGAR